VLALDRMRAIDHRISRKSRCRRCCAAPVGWSLTAITVETLGTYRAAPDEGSWPLTTSRAFSDAVREARYAGAHFPQSPRRIGGVIEQRPLREPIR